MAKVLKIFIIAGEPSGDNLGASFMHAFKEFYPNVEFTGIGGQLMERESLVSLFPMQELSIMGVAEVLPKIPQILSRIKQTVKSIISAKPDIVLTIDSPDFCFRVIKKLKKQTKDIPCAHYVAPTVWAWRAGRAKKVSKFLDHLLALFPFEPPYFEKYNLDTTFVGHPIVERRIEGDARKGFRTKYNIEHGQRVISVLPGSRGSEIDKLQETFNDVITELLTKVDNSVVIIPTLPHLKDKVTKLFVRDRVMVIDNHDDKFGCFKTSEIAIAASGTISLELALAKTPHIIAYKFNPISAVIARLLIKTKFANLINIILQRAVVPEMIQEDCTVDKIVTASLNLINFDYNQTEQLDAFKLALEELGRGDAETPSQKAAQAILKVIQSRGA